MPPRKSFPLRLPLDLYDEIKRQAGAELRSVNAQIEMLLRSAVQKKKRQKDEADQ